jgi:hypothetical protein
MNSFFIIHNKLKLALNDTLFKVNLYASFHHNELYQYLLLIPLKIYYVLLFH